MLRAAVAQINPTVGDIEGNRNKILEYTAHARKLGADIVAFPELVLCGYPPEDLLYKPSFISANKNAIKQIASSTKGIVSIVGFANKSGSDIYNSAAVISKGKIRGVYDKVCLPNYSVFDEKRYFQKGRASSLFDLGGITFGINICEDIWQKKNPVKVYKDAGIKIIFAINASPYCMGKINEREEVVKRQARANNAFVVYANLVGAQDELVFDGQSFIVSGKGKIIARADAFSEDLLIADLDIEPGKKSSGRIISLGAGTGSRKKPITQRYAKRPEPLNEVYEALTAGLKDYVFKNGFKKVIIGLSGGIDSALVAAISRDALGAERTVGVFMPSAYTSKESKRDAGALAENLGIELYTVPIGNVLESYMDELKGIFKGQPKNVAEENLQARIRGNILMALSNKFGYLVLNTGNKSEISCGYCTLYGDMAGGFSVIKDVPKMLVYKLARLVNSEKQIIPDAVLRKAPTAELKPNQKDADTLPPYEVLDPILKAYVEENKGLREIAKLGFDRKMVSRVIRMVDANEYKRRQAPPGIKITPRAFGKDRRMPITNNFTE